MAPRKTPTPPSRYPIGNCEVIVEGSAKGFTCYLKPDCLKVRACKSTRIQVSVRECTEAKEEENSSLLDCQFVLVNPKDADTCTKPLIQEVLNIYTKELPEMNYAANTGKKSTFLERCVSNGKYCTLLVRSNNMHGSGEVIAAISYQIIPADTQHAEIPLAAVCSIYQQKGIGRILYMELRKRLQAVGVKTILCWGDKESEGFWEKQGFTSVAEVDSKGKARKLPLKADIRRAICFPGGSVLMMSHLSRNHDDPSNSLKLNVLLNSHEKLIPSDLDQNLVSLEENNGFVISNNQISWGGLHLQPEVHCEQLRTSVQNTEREQMERVQRGQICLQADSLKNAKPPGGKGTYMVTEVDSAEAKQKAKRTFWEACVSSLGSKRIKASSESETRDDSYHDGSTLGSIRARSISEVELTCPLMACYLPKNLKECLPVDPTAIIPKGSLGMDSQTKGKPTIMLMDIADGTKKTNLTKVIENLGGDVSADGSVSTHFLTGKVRRTLNFCTALCSGAWILSPNWLKASFREGRFVDVMPFILEDEDYRTKFKIDLKEAVLKAKERSRGLLKGYQICLTTHVQPRIETLSEIVRSAGGNVVHALDDINDNSQAIFVACEEDMEEALLAVRRGLRTFSSDWFMSCIMKQDLDLDAPQFAESL